MSLSIDTLVPFLILACMIGINIWVWWPERRTGWLCANCEKDVDWLCLTCYTCHECCDCGDHDLPDEGENAA